MTQKRYIQVILPLRLEWEPCYYLPEGEVRLGDRVQVMFAGRKLIGVVSAVDVSTDLPESKIHPVLSIETGLEKVSAEEMELWRFMSEYYLCTVGEVYKASYPAPKTNSEEVKARLVRRRAALEEKTLELWKNRIARLRAQFSRNEKELAGKHKESILQALSAKRSRIISELQEAEDRLASMSRTLGNGEKDYSRLLAGLDGAAADPAYKGLISAFNAGKPVLLISAERHSAYIELAVRTLTSGRNVLILVNESALAGELRKQLEGRFGDLLIVHLSAFTPARKREISSELRSGRPYVLIGTRSSIFLPHRDLGLVIVDNEQSPFYKQTDSAPRYNGRDCAVKLALIHKARVLLGTGSPSLESRLNAINGRYLPASIPEKRRRETGITLIDTSAEKRKNGMLGPFSRKLLREAALIRSNDPGCRVALIRGFEREDELNAEIAGRPELEGAQVFSIPQASRTDFSPFAMVAMLSADALFDPSDFRSDEHAFQFLDSLRAMCPDVVVQTTQARHQVFSLTDNSPLLTERSRFNLPPYTRLVDIRIPFPEKTAPMVEEIYRTLLKEGIDAAFPLVWGGNSAIRITLKRDAGLQAKKKKLRSIVEDCRSKFRFSGNIILDVDPV